jgi:hypothetical protein
LCQGLALRAWCIEHNGWTTVERVGDGYIGQDKWKVMRRLLGDETVDKMRGVNQEPKTTD